MERQCLICVHTTKEFSFKEALVPAPFQRSKCIFVHVCIIGQQNGILTELTTVPLASRSMFRSNASCSSQCNRTAKSQQIQKLMISPIPPIVCLVSRSEGTMQCYISGPPSPPTTQWLRSSHRRWARSQKLAGEGGGGVSGASWGSGPNKKYELMKALHIGHWDLSRSKQEPQVIACLQGNAARVTLSIWQTTQRALELQGPSISSVSSSSADSVSLDSPGELVTNRGTSWVETAPCLI